jgi:hypothetical protein
LSIEWHPLSSIKEVVSFPERASKPQQGGDSDDGSLFRQREKQDVFHEAYMDVFTAVPKQASIG